MVGVGLPYGLGPFGFGLGNRLGQPNHKSGPAQTTNKFDLFRKIIILSKHQSKIKNPN